MSELENEITIGGPIEIAKFRSICPWCSTPIEPREQIAKFDNQWMHYEPCYEEASLLG